MKRILCIAAAVLSLCTAYGCGKQDSGEPELQTVLTNELAEATEETAETAASDKAEIPSYESPDSTAAVTTAPDENISAEQPVASQTVISFVTVLVTDDDTEASVVQSTETTEPRIETEGTQPAEGVNGAEGRTETEWMILGQEMYMEACELAFRYLCTGSEFPYDRENLEIIDKTYFLTTCASFDEATASYYELFSREYHESDFDGLLLEQNGRLYAARAARGMDMTYLSSEVERIVSVSDTEVVFEVLVQYEEEEVTTRFTLIPEDGLWKVGEFTLPY